MNGTGAHPEPAAGLAKDVASRRTRPLWGWAALFAWLVFLAILLEYALSSFAEVEPQAGILAIAIFFGFLVAGIIAILVHNVSGHFLSEDVSGPNTPDHERQNGVEHES